MKLSHEEYVYGDGFDAMNLVTTLLLGGRWRAGRRCGKMRLETVISCQCLSQRPPKCLEPVVDHSLVKALSSTVRGAVGKTVKRVPFAGRTINVIQGFHPSYILRAPNQEYRNDRLRVLTSVLTETYKPCQKWAKQNIANDLRDTTYQLQTTASAMDRFFDPLGLKQ